MTHLNGSRYEGRFQEGAMHGEVRERESGSGSGSGSEIESESEKKRTPASLLLICLSVGWVRVWKIG